MSDNLPETTRRALISVGALILVGLLVLLLSGASRDKDSPAHGSLGIHEPLPQKARPNSPTTRSSDPSAPEGELNELVRRGDAPFLTGLLYLKKGRRADLLAALSSAEPTKIGNLLLAVYSEDSEEVERVVQQLEELDPSNVGLPNLLRAGNLTKSGNLAGARKLLEQAFSMENSTDFYFNEMKLAALDVLTTLGQSDAHSRLSLGGFCEYDILKTIAAPAKNVMNSLSDEEKVEFTTTMIALSRSMRGAERQTSTASLITSNALEYEALSALDPTLEYGMDGQTVGNRMIELRQDSREIQEMLDSLATRAPGFSDEEAQAFVDRREKLGLRSALLWLSEKEI